MATALIPRLTTLIEVKHIVGFSADYSMQLSRLIRDEKLLHTLYVLCSNLYRVESMIKLEIEESGVCLEGQNYDPSALIDIQSSDINISQVVEQFLNENTTSSELSLLRKIL